MFHSYVSCLNHMCFNNLAWHDVFTEEANTIPSCLSMHPNLLFKVHLPVVHASKPVIQSIFTCCPCIQTCYSKYICLLSVQQNLLFKVHLPGCPCIETCYSKYTCLTFDIRQFIHTLCNHVSFFHMTPHWRTVKQNAPSAVPYQIVSKLTNPPDNTTPFQTVICMYTPSYVVMSYTCSWLWIRTVIWMNCSLLALQLLWTQDPAMHCYALIIIIGLDEF